MHQQGLRVSLFAEGAAKTAHREFAVLKRFGTFAQASEGSSHFGIIVVLCQKSLLENF